MYTFEHTKTEQLEANTDYRYIGDDPYNYMKFNNEMWRIIGVFPDEEGIYRIKLIRNEPYVSSAFDTTHRQEWLGGTNSWEHSDTRALMATKVNREIQEEYVEEAIYYLGGYNRFSGEVSNFSADEWYSIERGTKTYNSSIYPRKTNIKDKVALMYPSDFAYSFGKGVSEFCYTSSIYCRDGEEELGWMQKGLIPNGHGGMQYTTTSSTYDYSTIALARVGPITSGSIQNMGFVRPVVYLKLDIDFKSGDYDGSLDKPYELK